MLKFFKKEKDLEKNSISIISLASLLIHAAKIDENYSDKEKKIIKESLINLGANNWLRGRNLRRLQNLIRIKPA